MLSTILFFRQGQVEAYEAVCSAEEDTVCTARINPEPLPDAFSIIFA